MFEIHIYLIQFFIYLIILSTFLNYISYHRGILKADGLKKGIKISRDVHGIPHIEADNKFDALFGLGFVHAEDRLWQMYLNNLMFEGKMSETFHADVKAVDIMGMVFSSKIVCENNEKLLSAEEKELYKSYTEGINFYLDNTKILPLEFLLIGKYSIPRWSYYNTCMAFRLTEFLMSFDFLQESLRTYIRDNYKLSNADIFNMLPSHISQYEHKVSILKENEVDMTIKPKSKNINSASHHSYKQQTKTKSNDNNEVNEKIRTEGVGSGVFGDNIAQNMNLTGPGGSNNCIISGKYTESGFPILCNDPHLLNHMPAFWYPTYMEIADENMKILGASTAGVPCMLVGQNGYMMWGVTNGLTDTSNIIRLKKLSKDTYLLDGKEQKFSKRYETLCLPDYCEELEFLYVEGVGNVLNGYFKYIYLFFEQGDHADELVDEENYFYLITGFLTSPEKSVGKTAPNVQFSKSPEEFRSQLYHADIPLNAVFADKEGNIYYQHTGKIKIHYDDKGNVINNSGENFKKFPNLGFSEIVTTSDKFETENIPFEHLPYIKNPEKGYIVSANNIVAPENYPYLLPGAFYADSRARSMEMAIQKMIKDGKKITIEMVNENVLKNVYDPYALDNVNSIVKIVKSLGTNIKEDNKKASLMENELFRIIMNHDGNNHYDSLPALLYNVLEDRLFWKMPLPFGDNNKLKKNIIVNHQFDNFFAYKIKVYGENPEKCELEYGKHCYFMIEQSFNEAIDLIERKIGVNRKNWIWGNFNIKHYFHTPFSMVPGLKLVFERTQKTDGNRRTPKISTVLIQKGNHHSVISSNLKVIFEELTAKDKTYISIDTGISGKVLHERFNTLTASHEKGDLIKFNPDEVKKALVLQILKAEDKEKEKK